MLGFAIAAPENFVRERCSSSSCDSSQLLVRFPETSTHKESKNRDDAGIAAILKTRSAQMPVMNFRYTSKRG